MSQAPSSDATGLETPSKLEYQPALDGLRALAVIAVLWFHLPVTTARLKGGFLGVDVFFVLSGFLITSLLLIDHGRTGRVVSLRFWGRRARRLLPALLVFLVLVAIYAAVVARPTSIPPIREGAFATLLYVQNFWLIHHHPTQYPLNHTWSLSIEEQFYFVWPLLLAGLVWCTRRTSQLVIAVGVLIVASAALMAERYQHGGIYVSYFPTQTRAHELLVGALLGILLLRWKGPKTRWGGILLEVCGVGALAVLVVGALRGDADAPWMFRGGFLFFAVVTAVLITAAVSPSSARLRAVLGVKPLVFVGLISYGLYLFHIPIYGIVESQHRITDPAVRLVVQLLAVLVVATLSYYVVERPVRRGAFSGKRMYVALPAAIAVTVAVVLIGTEGGVVPVKSPLARLAAETPPGSVRVLVAGDAIAGSLGHTAPVYDGDGIYGTVVSRPLCDGIGGRIVVNSVAYPAPDCPLLDLEYAHAAADFNPATVVLMIGPLLVFDHVVDGRRLHVGSAAYERYIRTHLDQLRRDLTNGRPRQLVLATVPCMTPSTAGPLHAFAAAQSNPHSIAWVNRVFRRYAASRVRVRVADFGARLCRPPHGGPALRDGGGIGLSKRGAAATWQWIAPLVHGAIA